MADWNPGLYLRFERERTQPVRDLVARLEVRQPSRILDIGCGPGNSAAVLKDRWPKAAVTGLDNSRAMGCRVTQSPDQAGEDPNHDGKHGHGDRAY
jgi:trans-aconitate 2-methyltransferase